MTKRKVVWMLAGQGAQYYGMGRELYAEDPVFRSSMDRCDQIMRSWMRVSLTEVIYGTEATEAFDDTRVTHPALCAIQWSMAQTLLARGHRPDLILGYSLGEMVALILAGAISLEDGLAMLNRHATLMETATPAGAMLAVLAPPDTLGEMLAEYEDEVWIAAHNFENHCVLSGESETVAQLQGRLETSGVTVQRLPVRRAFHSPLMDAAEQAFQEHISGMSIRSSRFDVWSATTGGRSLGLSGMWTATRSPVQFYSTIQNLEQMHPDGLTYLDLGPAGTLATFLKYIGLSPASQGFTTLTPWGGVAKNLRAFEAAV